MDEYGKPETTTEIMGATAKEVADAARDQYDNMLIAIRRSPLQGVAIAAGIGFVLALLARR
jgi:ElaB/YqjD/DUF883 family membrane-anchored ribosome-binding protein